MKRLVLFSILSMAISISGPDFTTGSIGSAAFAKGKDPVLKQAAQPVAKKKPAGKKKATVPTDFEESKVRTVKRVQDDLHRQARRDNLDELSTNIKSVRSLQRKIDKTFAKLSETSNRNEPNKIFLQLSKYGNYKANPTLSTNARIVSTAIATVRLLDRALAIQKNCIEAKKSGDDIARINCEQKYKAARSEYHRKARKLKKDVREKLFDPLPKSPYDS